MNTLSAEEKPDFNYPKTVSDNALSDLKKAQAKADKPQIYSALIRYVVAQSLISDDNAQTCFAKIKDIRSTETGADYRAISLLLEARLYRNLSNNAKRNNEVHQDYPQDLTEWNSLDFNRRINEISNEIFSQIAELKNYSTKNYSQLITCNTTYFPTLLDVAYSMLIDRNMDDGEEPDSKALLAEWAAYHTTDIAPSIYIASLQDADPATRLADYKKYAQFEESGLLLKMMPADISYYDTFKAYLTKFPKSHFAAEIQNLVNYIELQEIYIHFPDYAASGVEIPVEVTLRNINDYTLDVYTVDTSGRDTRLVNHVETIHRHNSKKLPYENLVDTVMIKPLPHCQYTIIASFRNANGGTSKSTDRDVSAITDIGSFAHNQGTSAVAYAVDFTSGKPIKGANLMNKNKQLAKTDKNGAATFKPANRTDVHFETADDKYSQPISIYSENDRQTTNIFGKIFTDLAIYRPGETVKYTAVLHQNSYGGGSMPTTKPFANDTIKLALYDSNYNRVAINEHTTDSIGRISGEFTIPTDRMNGTFRIEVITGFNRSISAHFEVSEYKVPTFQLNFTDTHRTYNEGEDVIVRGEATTYAGMPLANTDISIALTRSNWYFWFDRYEADDNLVADTVHTDANGQFSITLPKSLFNNDGEHLRSYIYRLDAKATNATGESQECTHSFFVGQHRRLQFGDNELEFVNAQPVSLPIHVESSDEADKAFTCHYTLSPADNDSVTVASGAFNSDCTTIDLTKVPSGTYRITVTDDSHLAEPAKAEITLYRESDSACPKQAVLWVPQCGHNIADSNKAHITVGTTENEIYLFYTSTSKSTGKILEQGWMHMNQGLHHLDLQMPDGENEEMQITLATMRKGVLHTEQFTMISPARQVKAELRVVSFRDRITPGATEHLSFQLVDNHGKPLDGAALLAITDKAINSLADNSWYGYRPSSRQYYSFRLYNRYNSSSSAQASWSAYNTRSTWRLQTPELNFYGYYPFEELLRHKMMYRLAAGNRFNLEPAMCESAMVNASVESNSCAAEMTEMAEVAEKLDKIEIRDNDVKTALWLPAINTDSNGCFSVDFEAPNFNTTWIMQTIAYTANGYFSGTQRDIVASRPLMVKANMPRFVRNADTITLAADVANKTDETVNYNAVIELFDPRTGNTVESKNFSGSLSAMSSTAVAINYNVPAEASFIGFRIKAVANGNGDGEQVIVPILSNVSPVIETMPFFIDAEEAHFTGKIPAPDTTEKVTLEYCDNPVWYCATALPTMVDENASTTTALSHSLFALTVAQGLAKQNPQIAEAIDYWKQQAGDNNPLTSALARNSDLKIGTLLASPWLNEADRQTLQMSQLSELFNSNYCSTTINKIINRLAALQNADGGFRWYDSEYCKSSLWCTATLLEAVARMQHLGFDANSQRLTDMVNRALKYYDAEYLKAMKRVKRDASLISYSEYAYVRTMFKSVAIPKQNAEYIQRILQSIKKEWRDNPLSEKAFYALTLNNNGEKSEASKITESIRQFSITTPSRGMYWDRISRSWWRGSSVLNTTTLILQALNEVDHRTDEINQIRKWILLNKQTNDWGDSSLASEAVYTILATGSKWLTDGKTPEITIAGVPVIFDKTDRYLGYCRKQLNPKDVLSADISINRKQTTSPAWGAVYLQGKSSITSIKPASVSDLSIEKTILRYTSDGKLEKAQSLSVGDKVRVQCTVKCGKSIEYLTLTDQRGACFEPVDQTSGSCFTGDTWAYRETKDSQTNIFIYHLDKGTYVIGYDAYITNSGKFSVGIATIQSQYAPQFTAHSAGTEITVK